LVVQPTLFLEERRLTVPDPYDDGGSEECPCLIII
jgi:hypothetical protein